MLNEALHVPDVFERAPAEQRQHLGTGKLITVRWRYLKSLDEIAKSAQCLGFNARYSGPRL